jgi:hypothetical protein
MIKNTDFKLEEIFSSNDTNVIYFAYKNKSESIRVLIGFSRSFLGDHIVSDSRAKELTIGKKKLTQKEKEVIQEILITEKIEGQSIFNYSFHKALEVYESKKDKKINCVMVCFSANKISIEYYSHESPNSIPVSDRIFEFEESKQFLGWKKKYSDKI